MSHVTRRIVQELHDEPHLEGRRITVQFIKTKSKAENSPRGLSQIDMTLISLMSIAR